MSSKRISSALHRSLSRSSSDRSGRRKSLSSSSSSSSSSDGSKSSSSSSSYSFTSESSKKRSSNRKLSYSSDSSSNNKSRGKFEMDSELSDNNDSFHSSVTGKSSQSKAISLRNLEEEYTPIAYNLSFNVYQVLLSIKSSMINVYRLKKSFQSNTETMMMTICENKQELKSENEKISDHMIRELIGVLSLSEVVYGDVHPKFALAHINLAQVYLEFKSLPKQGKQHCEKAWHILIDNLKETAKHNVQKQAEEDREAEKGDNEQSRMSINSEFVDSKLYDSSSVLYPDSDKHQMLLNYIYGRCCTILRENEEGESALEKAEEYLENWRSNVQKNKVTRPKFKNEIKLWRQKIYLALAKQYAINGSNGNAIAYYDKCIDLIRTSKGEKNDANQLTTSNVNQSIQLLVEIFQDKAKIEASKANFGKAVDLLKDGILFAEKNESLLNECKLSLALVYAELDDMNSASKAEDLLNEVANSYNILFKGRVNEREIKIKEELVKFFLKQEKLQDAHSLLISIVKEKLEFYGDFNPRLNSTYKLLCSVYLKKNDMISAAKYLQKSLELEELNFGPKDERAQSTRETLENLKKNPSVMSKLTTDSKKPMFNASVRKNDYLKEDKKLYTKLDSTSSNQNDSKTSSRTNLDESTLSKKIDPIK